MPAHAADAHPSDTAPGPAAPRAADDFAQLGGDWWLWRDLVVRSAGFPVDGLGAFGPGDEPARLAAVAGDPAFREAVTWQNPAAAANALAPVAAGLAADDSKGRRRQEVVASYWQRYCAKNDTIGFFGPLAWGRVDDACDVRLRTRSGALEREREVHFEAWPLRTLAATLGGDVRVPLGMWPEREFRASLEAHPDAALRERGLAALGAMEAARDAVAQAPREALADALAALDATFTGLTGAAPTRNPGRAYGARTLAYVDSMRDLDLAVGPALLMDLAPAVRAVFEAGRWYCGRIQAIGREVVRAALPAGGSGPFGPVIGGVLGPLMALPPAIGAEARDLQRRWAALVADPDPVTLGERAAAAFADHAPAWPLGEYQSVDVQIAARDEAALADGDLLAVIADVHPGDNPLGQALFAERHPRPERLMRLMVPSHGTLALLMPPWGPGLVADSRGFPTLPDEAVHVAIDPESVAQGRTPTWRAADLWVDGEDVVDRTGALRVPAADVFGLPIFVASVRTFDLWGDAPHLPRLTSGRVVLRRETWNAPAGEIPAGPTDLEAWARGLGMPRRVFMKTPVERKPLYLDLQSPVMTRIACRHLRAAAEAGAPGTVRFTEMLPAPEGCWLADPAGRRYACELRLVGRDGPPPA